MTQQVLTMPVSMLPIVSTARLDGFQMNQYSHRQERPRNGIVYVGQETNRTKQLYNPKGLLCGETHSLGRLVNIYV